VLELGGGTGLVGITCPLAGAEKMVVADFPYEQILDNIQQNVDRNIFARWQQRWDSSVAIEGHKLGDIEDGFADANAYTFQRVIAAGCLWLPDQHENLAYSLTHFLAEEKEEEVGLMSSIFLGRKGLAGFFDIARCRGMQVREMFEHDALENKRPWGKSVNLRTNLSL
jgi:nicotinamide N-methyltransferase